MDRAMVRIVLACALTVAAGSVAGAQSNQASANSQQAKQKKHPNQVPDAGVDAPTPDTDTNMFEKVVDNVIVETFVDGTVAAQLDDSFLEAMTVSIGANGSLEYGHARGLETAARMIRLLPARPLPQVFPILEEKE